MSDFPFILLAALTLGSAGMVVANRNAIYSALSLLMTFAGMAGLFVLLGAYFLAVLQVLVYAGAIVVLFLFIVMLLDVDRAARRPWKLTTAIAGFIAAAILITGVLSFAKHGQLLSGDVSMLPAVGSNLKDYGRELFTTYLLPMQVTGFLLLIAMMGVIVLSRKQTTEEESQ